MPDFVIDTNSIQSGELRSFLEASTNNRVVICPPVVMEICKSLGMIDPAQDLSVLRDFTRQILVTKEMPEIYRARGSSSSIRKKLINEDLTKTYRDALQLIREPTRDRAVFQTDLQILAAKLAQQSVAEIADQAARLHATHAKLLRDISNDDQRAFKNGQPCSENFWKLFSNRCAALGRAHLERQVPGQPAPTELEFPNTYAYRLSVLSNCYFLDWMRFGSSATTQPAKIANDVVDMRIASIATFFDGLITNDNKLNRIYSLARWALSDIIESELSKQEPS